MYYMSMNTTTNPTTDTDNTADYHCPCGWSRTTLEGETTEDSRRAHEMTEVHRLATEAAV